MQNEATDLVVDAVRDGLESYRRLRPQAKIDIRRQNSVAIRIRVIDPTFAGMDRIERDDEIWGVLQTLPDEVQSQITMVLLLTPEEAGESFANLDFERPLQSAL
jgi:stress-induced morphogen